MPATANYLAFDLGASSGRAVLGEFDGQRLTLAEVHRFENRPVSVGGGLYWDAFRLFEEIKTGLRLCTQRGLALNAVGIDTWGVDFALLAADGELLAMPRHYRDPRNTGMMEKALERISRERVYETTGIQFMPINTVYQLLAIAQAPARLLNVADHLVFMPDLFAYWLTGVVQTERTIASTSQMMDAGRSDWDRGLLAALDIPAELMPPIRETGSVGGELLTNVSDDVGQAGTPLILTACHDTAAAVAAVPATRPDWAYISSGTWSLLGVELSSPVITPESREANFTNEAGLAGTTRFLRNVTGLWIVQECRRAWAAQGHDYSYEHLMQAAADAPPLASFVDPDDPRFAEPCDMPVRIREACGETRQAAPESPGEIIRCALESLALKYRAVLETLEQLIGRAITVLHIVGGGVKNELLNQFTADATGRFVLAGPVEATAAGNLMVQAWAQKQVASVDELRKVVAASSELKQYEPRQTDRWLEAYDRFKATCG